jgi:hypothetical protein
MNFHSFSKIIVNTLFIKKIWSYLIGLWLLACKSKFCATFILEDFSVLYEI